MRPVDGPANGIITIQTFNTEIPEVLSRNGLYTIWPMFQYDVNAHQWNSFCIVSNLPGHSIFLVRNGETINNFSQPKLCTDINIGLDTSALEPLQVRKIFY